MKKYIDYDSLEQEAYEIVCHARQQVDLIIANTIKSMIDKQPDAIVRCKDCKWYDEQISMCDNCGLPREQTFFCADCERRGDDA